jgi:hypothetical protein
VRFAPFLFQQFKHPGYFMVCKGFRYDYFRASGQMRPRFDCRPRRADRFIHVPQFLRGCGYEGFKENKAFAWGCVRFVCHGVPLI